jgi:hypothetical protein
MEKESAAGVALPPCQHEAFYSEWTTNLADWTM